MGIVKWKGAATKVFELGRIGSVGYEQGILLPVGWVLETRGSKGVWPRSNIRGEAPNAVALAQSVGDFVALSGALRGLAVEPGKIANGLRMMNSDPRLRWEKQIDEVTK